jgi:hypothetical protein
MRLGGPVSASREAGPALEGYSCRASWWRVCPPSLLGLGVRVILNYELMLL